MADIDLKTESPDASINDSAFLFGADSQSAASPSVYSVGTVRAHFVGAGTLNVASGKTLTASNTLTLAGTDGATMTFPSTSATLARTDAGNTFTGAQTFSVGTVNGTGLNLTQTWSGTGTYTGLQYNVTDSGPSNAASLLMDLQRGGVSQLSVRRDGFTTIANGATIGLSSNAGSAVPVTIKVPSFSSAFDFVFSSAGGIQSQTIGTGSGGIIMFPQDASYLGTTKSIAFTTAPGIAPSLFLTRRAAANLQLGASDAAAPVAQTLSVQSVVAGTSNTAGANLTITGSQGTGSGAGGSIIFQVAPAGSSGTAQNALATALTINSARQIIAETTSDAAPAFTFSGATGTGLSIRSTVGRLVSGGTAVAEFAPNEFRLGGTSYYSWAANSTADPGAASDVRLYRDAANTLALRNGTNAQTFNVYNTYTDASNYERGAFYWSGNTLTIATQNAGSGGNRGISVIGKGQVTIESTLSQIYFKTSSANRWFVDTTGAFNAAVDNTLDIGASGANRPRDLFLGRNLVQVGAYHEMAEMTAPAAPAANSVRIYAEDNGSGKTRLMALFATGAAQQIAIEP